MSKKIQLCVNPDTKIRLKKSATFFWYTNIHSSLWMYILYIYICTKKKCNFLFGTQIYTRSLYIEIPTRISSTILSIRRAARAVDREAEIFYFLSRTHERETIDSKLELCSLRQHSSQSKTVCPLVVPVLHRGGGTRAPVHSRKYKADENST